jgi:hypothetical protein
MNEIEKAKAVLRDAGFYVDNLWSINDISEGSNEERMRVLDIILTSEYIQGEIIEAIEREL